MMIEMALAMILAAAAAEQPLRVSLCELTKHPERYHSQLVTVPAMFHLDEWILYDPDCGGRDHWISVTDAPASEAPLASRITGSLSGVVKGEFTGRFQGPRGYGYAHLGTRRSQLQVLEASELRRARRPKLPDHHAPAPWLALEKAVEELDSSWLAAFHERDSDRIRETLSEEYVAILPNGEMSAGLQAAETLVLPHHQAIKARTAEGVALSSFESTVRTFAIDLRTAVLIRQISLRFVGEAAPAVWEYVNVYRKTGSRWRLAFSRFTRAGSRLHPPTAGHHFVQPTER